MSTTFAILSFVCAQVLSAAATQPTSQPAIKLHLFISDGVVQRVHQPLTAMIQCELDGIRENVGATVMTERDFHEAVSRQKPASRRSAPLTDRVLIVTYKNLAPEEWGVLVHHSNPLKLHTLSNNSVVRVPLYTLLLMPGDVRLRAYYVEAGEVIGESRAVTTRCVD